MSVRIRITVLAAAAVLALSGCGPDLSRVGVAPQGQSGNDTTQGDAGGVPKGGFAFNSNCLAVAGAYATIAMALLPSLSGSGTYDAGQISQAISGLGGNVPPELKGDFETLSAAAKAAQGKSFTDAAAVLGAPAPSAASDHISKWMDKNCGS
jgi:hypothetical protein